jgi:hypothetical protein
MVVTQAFQNGVNMLQMATPGTNGYEYIIKKQERILR